ncbi:MAG: putative F0F1-ATPase subunit Ca2+/Mg2+ transporter [Blastocatellia bacterium]
MPTNDENDKGGGVSWRTATATVGLALAIPSMLFVPVLVGWWIDRKYATSPLWLIVGLVIGLLGTAFDVYRLLKRMGQLK